MENSEIKSAAKSKVKKTTSSAVRVAFETRKKLLLELAKINKKALGKRVRLDALLLKLISKITAEDVAELQEASLTGRDRMEQNYRAYCAKFGAITMDEFLALISRETVLQILKGNSTKISVQSSSTTDGKIDT